MLENYIEYFDALTETQKKWQQVFTIYMQEHYPAIPRVMFRSRPMYKFFSSYQKGYLMFLCNKDYFTMHIIDFELIEAFKDMLPFGKYGKGSIKIKYKDEQAIPILYKLIDRVVKKHFN